MKQVLSAKSSFFFILRKCHFISFICLAALFVCSCQKGNDHQKVTVPFQAEFSTLAYTLQQGPPEIDSIVGKGQGTPIGKSTFADIGQFDSAGNFTNAPVFTAENGDHIFCIGQGHSPDIDENGDITLHFTAKIVGGTGKFAGATGNFSATTNASIYTNEGSVSFDGTITY